MPCRPLPRNLGVIKLPPWVTVEGLLTYAEVVAFIDAREAALALQAADILWHSAATPRARRSYRSVHHGLDAGPYHERLIELWDDLSLIHI